MIEKVLIIIESQKDENNNFLNITVEGQNINMINLKIVLLQLEEVMQY